MINKAVEYELICNICEQTITNEQTKEGYYKCSIDFYCEEGHLMKLRTKFKEKKDGETNCQ